MKEESYIRNVKYFLEELIRGCGIIQKEKSPSSDPLPSISQTHDTNNLPKMQKRDFMITIQMKSITAC